MSAEFRKRHARSESLLSLWFYRDGQGREVDFVEMGGGQLSLCEAKWAEEPDPRWLANVREAAGLLGSGVHPIGTLGLICRTVAKYYKDGVTVMRPHQL